MNIKGMCLHAEIDVAMKLINCYIKKKGHSKGHRIKGQKQKMYDVKKYIIWVVRADKASIKTNKVILNYSAPCGECIRTLMSLGFKKIGYSDKFGKMSIHNISDLDQSHLSFAQMNYIINYKHT
jgi:deoxycytidylate deaminase